MSYSNHLRKLFPEITLIPEDLLLLESFQIKYLPDRVPKKEFAALLRANPIINRYFIAKYPPIEKFIDAVLNEIQPISKASAIEAYCQELLWEIGELIVYNKYPEVFNKNVTFNWKLEEIITPESLQGKTIVDVGSGTGQLAFLLAPKAQTVYAVEPIESLRQFIRNKANEKNIKNLFVVDGFLDMLPFPDNSVDILMTSNAIGWNIEKELIEIERVVKQGGETMHIFRILDKKDKNPFHDILISKGHGYSYKIVKEGTWQKLKYSKTIIKFE